MKFHLKTNLLLLVVFLSVNVFAAPVFIDGVVPFYSQSNAPSNVYACGHSALRSAAMYVRGVDKDFNQIHDIMISNSPGGYAKKRCSGSKPFCASLYDLQMAVNEKGYVSHKKGNGLRKVNNYSEFLQKIKDGVKHKTPAISVSTFEYKIPHFYVIVGYDEKSKPEDSIIYLRHGLGHGNGKYDNSTTVKDFYDNLSGSKQILFVIK